MAFELFEYGYIFSYLTKLSYFTCTQISPEIFGIPKNPYEKTTIWGPAQVVWPDL